MEDPGDAAQGDMGHEGPGVRGGPGVEMGLRQVPAEAFLPPG